MLIHHTLLNTFENLKFIKGILYSHTLFKTIQVYVINKLMNQKSWSSISRYWMCNVWSEKIFPPHHHQSVSSVSMIRCLPRSSFTPSSVVVCFPMIPRHSLLTCLDHHNKLLSHSWVSKMLIAHWVELYCGYEEVSCCM